MARVTPTKKKKDDTKEDLLQELTELSLAISKANKLANSGHAAIQALQERERQISTLMSNLPGMVFRLLNDKNWTIVFLSEGCLQLTGYKPSDVAQKKPNYYISIVHPDDRERLRFATKEGLKNKERIREEYRIVTASGEVKWVWEQSTGIYSEQGEVLGIEGFVTDITERVRTRKALQKSEHDLRILSAKLLTAQETERKRISQELHDSVGQLLGTANISVETAIGHLDSGSVPQARKTLGSVISIIQSVAEEISMICNNLRPPLLDDIGIIAAISWWCREFQTFLDVKVKVQFEIEEIEVPDDLKIVIYRVLQESLNNAAKHSRADLVRVTFKKAQGTLMLSVKDDGIGFKWPAGRSREVQREGLGIASMKERVENSGGTFIIRSGRSSGTIIEASWHL